MATLAQFRVSLLGGFGLIVDDEMVTAVHQPQQQSLLAYLILQTTTPQIRRTIAFHFWPDASEKRAFANLRAALHKLRHDCPVIKAYLLSTSTTLGWQRSDSFHLDVHEYETHLAQVQQTTDPTQVRGCLERAIAAYQGELLPGCYDEWILSVRERLNQSYLLALQQLVDLLTEMGEYETAVSYAHQLRSSDPFREQSYQRLMALHEAQGDRATALRVYHDCVTMLERELGVPPSPETQAIYGCLLNHTTPPATRQTAVIPPSGNKVIGREAEWQCLQAAWHKASQGKPTLALIQGEAGMGKTHLGEALLAWAKQHGQLAVQTRAYAAEGQLTYSPVIEWLRSPIYAQALTSLEDVWLTECARLLPELLTARPDLPPPPPISESWQRQRLFEALARAALILQKPLLILFDDLQWADKETLEWLHFLLRFEATFPLLLVGTVRLSEVAKDHPLTILKQGLHRDSRIQELSLEPITAAASDELARQIFGSQLTPEILTDLHQYAEGVPLFLVEAVRAEMDKVEAERWRWSMDTSLSTPHVLPLPPKVYAVIQARLNQLSPGARQLANVGAVIGRAFSLELLTLASHSDEENLVKNLDELWQRRIIREQGIYYDLNHDRIRDVIYAEIPPMQRKQLHRYVAEALAQRHVNNLDDVSSQLATHYEAAGLLAQAVDYYFQAGESSQRVYAHDRACYLLNRGIDLIKHLPATLQRDQQELSLYATLAVSLRAIKGWTSKEMYEAANYAWQLNHKLNDLNQRFRLIKLMFAYEVVCGNLEKGEQWAIQSLEVAEQEKSDTFLAIAYNNLAGIHLCKGHFKTSQKNFQQSLNHYNSQHHPNHVLLDGVDYGILSLVWSGHILWLVGDPNKAIKVCREGVNLAQQLNHPYSQVLSVAYLIMLYQFRREISQVIKYSELCLQLVAKYNIGYYLQWANIFYAWTRAIQNPDHMGVLNLQKALDEFDAIGGKLRWPFYLSLLANIYEQTGQIEDGLETINRAFLAAARHGENWWNAELYRLQGNLQLLQGERDLAEQAYQKAIALARHQEALSLELRAIMSLARLWQKEERIAVADEELSAVYDQFTEGFDTPDLQDAQKLLVYLKK